ncbi:hypothetical protein ACP4OV_023856 [Aristida adscensionis]
MIGPSFSGERLWRCMIFLLLCCNRLPSSSPSLIATAEDHVVTHLPGFEGPLPFHLQTGYVEVDEANGVRLFYYFIRSERSPGDDPLMLWLSGGPGCTSFTGLVYQIGPMGFDPHGYMNGVPKLVYRPESWTKLSNIIFLDSPVGAGFSYSLTEEGYISSDTKAVNQIVIFLRKWLALHPEFLPNPLYIGGDSYAGMIVPTVTSEIARSKHIGVEAALNLKGYLVGNGFVDGVNIDVPSRIPYAHRMGFISDEIYEAYKKSCGVGNISLFSYRSVQCANSLDTIDQCVKDICLFHILEPNCAKASPHPKKLLKPKLSSGVREMLQAQESAEGLHLSEISTQCRTAEYTLSRLWANDPTVREALGIHKGTVPSWIRCHTDIPYTEDIQNVVKYHLDVTTKGYRSLIYNGDHDMGVPFIGTHGWIKSLNFSVVEDWRPWYVNGQVAGYTISYSNNLTFATVKGAGHTAPEYMPTQCLAMLARWLAGDTL